MLKSGAHRGATGEYPMICACEHADYILVPGDECRVHIAGCGKYDLSEYAAIAVDKIKEVLK